MEEHDKDKEVKEHKEHKQEVHPRKKKLSVWKISTFVVAVIAIVFIVLFVTSGTCGITGQVTASEASENAVDFINTNLLQGQEAELGEISEESGLYTVELNIGGQVLQAFVSRDGKYLFPNAIDLTIEVPGGEGEGEAEPDTLTCDDITKAENAQLDAFVVSYCPFGVQMQRILAELADDFGDNIKLRYIGAIVDGEITAMHGEKEATENLRQICIREEQSDKFWDYIRCFIKEQDQTEACLTEAGIDTTELDACMADAERGNKYAQEDFDIQNEYGITGSPTLLVNGQQVIESPDENAFALGTGLTMRSAELTKTLVCCGYETEPEQCSKEFKTVAAARSFSATYSGSSDGGNGGTC